MASHLPWILLLAQWVAPTVSSGFQEYCYKCNVAQYNLLCCYSLERCCGPTTTAAPLLQQAALDASTHHLQDPSLTTQAQMNQTPEVFFEDHPETTIESTTNDTGSPEPEWNTTETVDFFGSKYSTTVNNSDTDDFNSSNSPTENVFFDLITVDDLNTTTANPSEMVDDLNATTANSMIFNTTLDTSNTSDEMNSTDSSNSNEVDDVNSTAADLNNTSAEMNNTILDLSNTSDEWTSTTSDLSNTTDEWNSTISDLSNKIDEINPTTFELSNTTPSYDANNSTSIDENNSTSMDENNSASVDMNNSTSVDENNSTSVDENNSTSVDMNDSTSMDENNSTSMDENNSTSVDVNDSTSMDENNSTSMDMNDSTSMDENNSTSMDMNDSTSMDANITVTPSDLDENNTSDGNMILHVTPLVVNSTVTNDVNGTIADVTTELPNVTLNAIDFINDSSHNESAVIQRNNSTESNLNDVNNETRVEKTTMAVLVKDSNPNFTSLTDGNSTERPNTTKDLDEMQNDAPATEIQITTSGESVTTQPTAGFNKTDNSSVVMANGSGTKSSNDSVANQLESNSTTAQGDVTNVTTDASVMEMSPSTKAAAAKTHGTTTPSSVNNTTGLGSQRQSKLGTTHTAQNVTDVSSPEPLTTTQEAIAEHAASLEAFLQEEEDYDE